MTQRMVFSDMDGTFLADDKSVPALNLRALDAVLAHGDAFVPCTGRLLDGVPQEVLAHPAVTYAISANGSCVFERSGGDWVLVHGSPMDAAALLAAARAVADMDVLIEFFGERSVLLTQEDFDSIERYYGGTPFIGYVRRTRRAVAGGYEELVARFGPLYRMNIRARRPEVARQARAALAEVPGLCLATSVPEVVDVTAAGVDKGRAAAWLAERSGAPLAACIAFGDADNDAGLLRAVGAGVAVENAVASVREAADATALSNNEAGVGAYLTALYHEKEGLPMSGEEPAACKRALRMHETDDVVTVLADVSAGEDVDVLDKKTGGVVGRVLAREDAPCYHKLALRDIPRGAKVRKYGEVIGIAVADIARGEYVHVHNIESAKTRSHE